MIMTCIPVQIVLKGDMVGAAMDGGIIDVYRYPHLSMDPTRL